MHAPFFKHLHLNNDVEALKNSPAPAFWYKRLVMQNLKIPSHVRFGKKLEKKKKNKFN